jgi:uncharacterized repeat protein (TIGR01451 family)
LRATVTHNVNPVPVTSNVVMTVTIQNLGPAAATGVVVTNTVASSMTALTATPSQGTCNNVGGRIVCNLGNLAVNGSATISLTARANSPGTAITTVRVSGNEGDGDPSNNFVAHVTPVVTPTVAFSNPANLVIADATSTSPGWHRFILPRSRYPAWPARSIPSPSRSMG